MLSDARLPAFVNAHVLKKLANMHFIPLFLNTCITIVPKFTNKHIYLVSPEYIPCIHFISHIIQFF